MTTFREAYANLNAAQRQAVDIIYGPLLVIAGPGTGKTQLLALRVANILEQTDIDARSILCLTFTESAQLTMQERLVSFIGEAAYKVAVHTFHSFASEVISRNSEFFDESATSTVADGITSHEILLDIFGKLPYGNPLIARDGDDFVHLPSVRSRISHLKQAGLKPEQLRGLVDRDEAWLATVGPFVDKTEAAIKPRLSLKHLPVYQDLLKVLADNTSGLTPLFGYRPLSQLAVESLQAALTECESIKKTTPLSAWRRSWLSMTSEGAYLNARDQHRRLQAVADIYETYQERLEGRHLRDFDDLILSVNESIQANPDLQARLQEQYQFVLVDEYQDTNGSQQRLMELLSSSDTTEDTPNLMVVGDDDQAIYGFQGANPNYMSQFRKRWNDVQTISLTENYRSTPEIVDFAKATIAQASYHDSGDEPFIGKDLLAVKPAGLKPKLLEYGNSIEQAWAIADDIKSRLDKGASGNSIAILAPRHRMLQGLMPYLLANEIPVSYERRDNVLEQIHIAELVTMARVVLAIAEQRMDEANALLPELLSSPFWKLPAAELWNLQLARSEESWLAQMIKEPGLLGSIAKFLMSIADCSHREPLETILDMLIGTQVVDNFVSPFFSHYFSDETLTSQPSTYLEVLSGLRALRLRISNYHPEQTLKLSDFISYVDLARSAGEYIVDTHPVVFGNDAVHVMTAHKSKGQEFGVVYLINADQKHWVSDRGRSSTISLPANLPIEPEPEDDNERLRRWYVGLTRAADELIMTRSLIDERGKDALPLQWLTPEPVKETYDTPTINRSTLSRDRLVQGMQFDWRGEHAKLAANDALFEAQVTDRLKRYHLSATHLSTFLDLQYGDPKAWLVDQFLGFPRAKSRDAVFGTIMHRVMELAQLRVGQSQPQAIDHSLKDYQRLLSTQRLSDRDRKLLEQRGARALSVYLTARPGLFKPGQRPEYKVSGGQVVVDGTRLVGAIDLLQIDTKAKALRIIDFKTGKSFDSWKPKQVNHQLRLHGYKRQLMFYKLLLEHSREFSGYTVKSGQLEFLEPDENGHINNLHLDFDSAEMEEFKELVSAVWLHMQSLNLPDISLYPVSIKGALQLESDLRNQIL